MIKSLKIHNYALIRDLELKPCPGFNIITGETGAGKSIIMGALALLQGKRADARSIGVDGDKAVVEATFELSDASLSAVKKLLEGTEIQLDSPTLIMRREVRATGRSKALVNGVQAPLTLMEALSDVLIDIHSQHKNLLLGDADFQRQILDSLADNGVFLKDYEGIYADYRRALRAFADTRDEIARTSADADYLEFLLNELNELNLQPGEEAELQQQRETLANATVIGEKLSAAATALTWSEASASELLSNSIAAIADLEDISEEYASLKTRLETIRTELDDVAETVAARASVMRDDPNTLDYIEKRLDRIYALRNKHHVDTADALIAVRESLSTRLDELNDSENVLKALENKARQLKRTALEKATEISSRRRTAAEALSQKIMDTARPLGMANLVCEIRVDSGKLNPHGCDTVQFLFAFNKNQEPAPVGSRASGGEISRVMLALKAIIARQQGLPTIVFDEIDTGVSGDVAVRMGQLMAEIGRHIQVLTITHLPQIAAMGECHFKVYKLDEESSTQTHISLLTPAERRGEIALMLSGDASDSAALAAADTLLKP